MKHNLVFVGFDYALLRRLSTYFAESFDMRFFDVYDYFNFDNQPNTIADLYKRNGWDYVDSELRGAVKMVDSFDNVIYILDLKIAGICKDLFESIKEKSLVVYVEHNQRAEAIRKNISVYKSLEELAYFQITDEQLAALKSEIINNFADIVISQGDLTYEQKKNLILEEFKKMV